MRTRILSVVAALALALGLGAAPAQAAEPVTPAANFDVPSYLGTWYQIADIPQFYEAACKKNTTANYSLRADGSINVKNTCVGPFGLPITANGRAKALDPAKPSVLEVTFVTFFDWAYYRGTPNYVVLSATNGVAVVGSFDRSTAYILSRTKALTSAQLDSAKAVLSSNGYNPCTLIVTPQDGGLSSAKPLC